MKTRFLTGAAVAIFATFAIAHENVQNPVVKARMMAMSQIGGASKILGNMARGRADYDAAAARAAAQTMADQAALVPALFEAQEDDPESEALPAIWDNFADFTAKAQALEAAAEAAAQTTTLAALQAAMADVGGSCRSCHKPYRE